jgi:hypothetical protein
MDAKELSKRVKAAMGDYPRATKVRVVGLECEVPMIAVRYHETDVVKLYLDKTGSEVVSVVLNSGGWLSKTTAERMNAALRFLETGFFVRFTYKRTKFVFTGAPRQMGDSLHDQKFTVVGNGAKVPFEDGMTFKRGREGFKLSTPSKAKQKRVAALDEPQPCFYCKSDDHASYNCEERHR